MRIVDRVSQLCKEHETQNPFKICGALGIEVLFSPLVGIRGMYLCEEGVNTITLSSSLQGRTLAFVCAHELGHAQMHSGINRIFMDMYTYAVPGRYENEADRFASQMLFGAPPLFGEAITAREMSEILNVRTCNVNARMLELDIYY